MLTVGERFRAAAELWWDRWGCGLKSGPRMYVSLFKTPRMNEKIEPVGEEQSFTRTFEDKSLESCIARHFEATCICVKRGLERHWQHAGDSNGDATRPESTASH